MALPHNLERLKHISIDTLSLSESTSALLKWHRLTSIFDCIRFFYGMALGRGKHWHGYFIVMFAEVKPALMEAGCWDLVLDAEVWQAFSELEYDFARGSVVRWQGRDVDLAEISFEQLGISEKPLWVHRSFKSVGECINFFIISLNRNPKLRLQIGNPEEMRSTALHFDEYLGRVVQPRLAEMGFWVFVEAHIDDFRIGDGDENDAVDEAT